VPARKRKNAMGLKLRQLVTYISTPAGMVFRLREDFLPVDGRWAGDYFQRLLPYLDGKWTMEQLCSALNGPQKDIVSTLLRALKEAGMLYDSAGQHEPLPESWRTGSEAYIRRAEYRSSDPVRDFRAAVASRLLVVGDPVMAVAVLEAALEAGFSHGMIVSDSWNEQLEQRLANALKVRSGAECRRVPIGTYLDWDSMEKFDAVVLAACAGSDCEKFQAALPGPLHEAPLLPFWLCGTHLIAGRLGITEHTACSSWLEKRFQDRIPSSTPPSASRLAAGIRIGARLLIQRWIDWKTHLLSTEEHWLSFALDLHSLRISLCPMLPSLSGEHSAPSVFTAPVQHDMEPCALLSENWQDKLWASACNLLIHPITGYVARITEAELVQLPCNQSAAEWYLPGEERVVWSTETATDVRDARIAVLRLALEGFFGKTLEACALNTTDTPVADLIVSTSQKGRLVPESFFRTLACLADGMENWGKITAKRPALTAETIPITGYLQDSGELEHVDIYRQPQFAIAGCAVLKFVHRGKRVSVLAGLDTPQLWSQGFRDVWLAVTQQQGLPRAAETWPGVRYRCSEDPVEQLMAAMDSLCRKAGLALELSSLPLQHMPFLKPLVFVRARLFTKTAGRGTGLLSTETAGADPVRYQEQVR
jgi:hypothetical protein